MMPVRRESGVSPAEGIRLSKRLYDVRSADGSRFLRHASAEQGEIGIAQGLLALVRSGSGDYLIVRTATDSGHGGFMARPTWHGQTKHGTQVRPARFGHDNTVCLNWRHEV